MTPQRLHRPHVLGVDPGGRFTGLCLRSPDGGVVEFAVLDRNDYTNSDGYRRAVVNAVRNLAGLGLRVPSTVAVEDLNPPSPHMGMVSVQGLLGTGVILGAVLTAADPLGGAIRVPPSGHGGKPLVAYPPELHGARETNLRQVGTGKLRHARSAYDIAGVAGVYADPPFGVLPRPYVMR